MINPTVLVFDVNETILDIRALEPFFTRVFGRPEAMRSWYAQLILHAEAVTLAGLYAPLNVVSAGVLRMMGAAEGVLVGEADVADLAAQVASLPPHADVRPAFERLRAGGLRLVTLTNSPPNPAGSPLDRAGLGDLIEQQFSVDAVRRYKPAPETYSQVASALGVPHGELCLVAAHGWDVLGAKTAGCAGALVLRPGKAAFHLPDMPEPDIVAPDFAVLADRLLAGRGS
jgi:2-haloacid dehalogenase